jgi:hypothetical protein
MKQSGTHDKDEITYSPNDVGLTKLVFDQDYVRVVERRFINLPIFKEGPLELKVKNLTATENSCKLETEDSTITCPAYMITGNILFKRGFLKAVIRPIRLGLTKEKIYVTGAMANMGLCSIPFLGPRVDLQVHVYLEVDGRPYAGGCFANSRENKRLKAGIYPLEKKLADIKPDFDADLILLPGYRTKTIFFEK